MKANFRSPAKTDCVYVTAPVVSRQVETAFYCFLEPWLESFDSEIGTVPPENIMEAALEARKQFPENRLIVHYLQPHYPFIGAPDLRYAAFNGTEEVTIEGVKQGATDIWEAVGLGYGDADEVWEAYSDNLRRVLDAIEPLLDHDGRAVVTSDHGNNLGERMPLLPMRLNGPPTGIHHPTLREVTWAVVDGESVDDGDRQMTADVEEQLRSLGYAD